MWDIEKIKKDVKENLSSYRYEHSIRVMEEATLLAKRYDCDILKCQLCALTHDLCKEFSALENEEFVKEHDLPIELLNIENRNLIHGYIASIVVFEKYHFTDDMVLSIRYHSTGYPNMDLLAKIIYLADKIESGKTYPFIDEERKLAYEDIDKAIIFCLKNQIRNLKAKNKVINHMAYDTLDYLENIGKKIAILKK